MTSARGFSGGASFALGHLGGEHGAGDRDALARAHHHHLGPRGRRGAGLGEDLDEGRPAGQRVGPGARHLPHHVDGLAAVLLHHDRDLGVADEAAGEKDDELLLELRGRHVRALHPADEGKVKVPSGCTKRVWVRSGCPYTVTLRMSEGPIW